MSRCQNVFQKSWVGCEGQIPVSVVLAYPSTERMLGITEICNHLFMILKKENIYIYIADLDMIMKSILDSVHRGTKIMWLLY